MPLQVFASLGGGAPLAREPLGPLPAESKTTVLILSIPPVANLSVFLKSKNSQNMPVQSAHGSCFKSHTVIFKVCDIDGYFAK